MYIKFKRLYKLIAIFFIIFEQIKFEKNQYFKLLIKKDLFY